MLALVPLARRIRRRRLRRWQRISTPRGMKVGVSAPRRAAAALHEALREAELLVELASRHEASLATQEETYRLLIGVLLRDPTSSSSCASARSPPLSAYDAEHDTELLATLQAFLAHHGSTTETAEAMRLHRHTVGYRLTTGPGGVRTVAVRVRRPRAAQPRPQG